jgi:DNA-binding transcriptional LysR family regulator
MAVRARRQASTNFREGIGHGEPNNMSVRAALDGLGIAYMAEAHAEPFLRSGQLIRVLENWSPYFEGLLLYYPSHRQAPAALRALINMLRAQGPARRAPDNPFASTPA